jgi:hypothetical protein
VVDDARIYIALGMSRLLALDDTPATGCPARDTRVFPVTWLGPATFIGAALLTSALVVVAMTVIIALKIY